MSQLCLRKSWDVWSHAQYKPWGDEQLPDLLWSYFPVREVRRWGKGNQTSWHHMPGISPQDSQQHCICKVGVWFPWSSPIMTFSCRLIMHQEPPLWDWPETDQETNLLNPRYHQCSKSAALLETLHQPWPVQTLLAGEGEGGEEEQMSSHAFARWKACSQNGHVCEVWCPKVIIKL